MGYNSKNIKAVEQIISLRVERTCLMVHSKNLVKVTKIMELSAERDHLL